MFSRLRRESGKFVSAPLKFLSPYAYGPNYKTTWRMSSVTCSSIFQKKKHAAKHLRAGITFTSKALMEKPKNILSYLFKCHCNEKIFDPILNTTDEP